MFSFLISFYIFLPVVQIDGQNALCKISHTSNDGGSKHINLPTWLCTIGCIVLVMFFAAIITLTL